MALIDDHHDLALAKMDQIMDQITEVLQGNQARLQKILDPLALPIVISNLSNGTIEFINVCAATLLGFSWQEKNRFRETSFWQDISDRNNFVKQIQQKKRVDSFEAPMVRFNPKRIFSIFGYRS